MYEYVLIYFSIIFPNAHFDCLQFWGIMNKGAMVLVHTYTNIANHAFLWYIIRSELLGMRKYISLTSLKRKTMKVKKFFLPLGCINLTGFI